MAQSACGLGHFLSLCSHACVLQPEDCAIACPWMENVVRYHSNCLGKSTTPGREDDMRPSQLLELHRDRIREIVAERGHSNLRVFGSVARGEDDENSDIDFLVEFNPDASGFDFGDLCADLSSLLGIETHILTPASISPKYREQVLREAIAI
jgi:predicted nucleotidyltransferase